MKKVCLVVFLSLVLICPALSQAKPVPGADQLETLKARYNKLSPEERQNLSQKIQNRLKTINQRLATVKDPLRRAKLQEEQKKLRSQMLLLASISESAGSPAAALPPPPPPSRVSPEQASRPIPPPPPPEAGLRLGLAVGALAGITGAQADAQFSEPFGLVRTSGRVGVAYAQGNDSAGTARKHALVVLDGLYHLNPPETPGLRSYFGLGLNFDAYTSGQKSGTLGGQAFYGVEGSAGGGSFFAQLGYTVIRTGFSPNQAGLTGLVGYRL
jgi:hypothetical protein